MASFFWGRSFPGRAGKSQRAQECPSCHRWRMRFLCKFSGRGRDFMNTARSSRSVTSLCPCANLAFRIPDISQEWRCPFIMAALQRLRKGGRESKASVGYTQRPCLRSKRKESWAFNNLLGLNLRAEKHLLRALAPPSDHQRKRHSEQMF